MGMTPFWSVCCRRTSASTRISFHASHNPRRHLTNPSSSPPSKHITVLMEGLGFAQSIRYPLPHRSHEETRYMGFLGMIHCADTRRICGSQHVETLFRPSCDSAPPTAT
ncbi:hypothetical protein Hypma_014234 [Hypsizygus marmoreus]|uniref:Uncharacterized protein n=1 Tax=Hypsizygus marmoreus TaxID=39966 RepID=A0A369JB68_HYPMA|nr:hypothetical protein Hypma_014234 [Hypsizygus marmoreus]